MCAGFVERSGGPCTHPAISRARSRQEPVLGFFSLERNSSTDSRINADLVSPLVLAAYWILANKSSGSFIDIVFIEIPNRAISFHFRTGRNFHPSPLPFTIQFLNPWTFHSSPFTLLTSFWRSWPGCFLPFLVAVLHGQISLHGILSSN